MIFLFFVAIGNGSHAQRTKIDSLQKLLLSLKQDTATVKQYDSLSLYYFNIDNDSAVLYGNKALELSKKIKWRKGQAGSEKRLFRYYFKKGNHPKALSLMLSAIEGYEQLKDTVNIIDCLNRVARIYKEEDDPSRAIIYAKRCHALAVEINNLLWIQVTAYNLATDYLEIKMADSSLFYFQKCYQLANAVNDNDVNKNHSMLYSLQGLGNVHLLMNDTDLALSYLYKSIPFAFKINDPSLLRGIYFSMAEVFKRMERYDSSLIYSEKALMYAIKDNNPKRLIEVYKQLANLYKGENNEKAVEYFGMLSALSDSLFTSQKRREMANLTFNEEERQKELLLQQQRESTERKHNLQYAGIAIGLIAFVILFLLLSRSIIVKTKFIEFFGVLGLLAVFEFINLFIHPYLGTATNHSPVLMLAVLIAIAALLIPLHHKLEKWITKIMVEKNKKIRLAAAKKTIATLEGEQPNQL